MGEGTKRARNAKRARADEKQGKQGEKGERGKLPAKVRRAAAKYGDGIGPSTY